MARVITSAWIFLILYLLIERIAVSNSEEWPSDSERTVTLSRHTSRSERHNREGRFGFD